MRLPTSPSRYALSIALALLAAPVVGQEAAPAAPAEIVEPAPAPAVSVPAESVGTEAAPTPEAPVGTEAPAATEPTATDELPAAMEPPAMSGELPAMDAAPASEAPAIPESTLPHDLSPWGMFMAADFVVKSVMIGLAIASVLTWTIWLAKSLELAGAATLARNAQRAITKSRTLEDAIAALGDKSGVASLLAKAAEEEVQLSYGALDHADGDGLKERVSSRLARLVAAAGRRVNRGTGVLATIGSTSPFVGLFGTVWGIMNSFIGISEAQTTNLAIVAPGIAEALLATAIGLVAAIPAVVIYNVFSRAITGYRQQLGDVSSGIERLVSRDLDWRKVPARSSLRGAGALAEQA